MVKVRIINNPVKRHSMKLILVRHGETIENISKICQGQKIGGTLTKEGIQQAKKLALRLKDEKIDKIYSSDLKRAKDTAKEIIKYHPKTEVEYTPALRERNWGIYECKKGEEITKAIGRKTDESNFTPEKGESYAEMRKRISKFINNLIKKEHNKTILLVTHGGPIMHLLLHLFQQNYEKHKKYMHHNCALTILEINRKQRKILTLNCCKHLN